MTKKEFLKRLLWRACVSWKIAENIKIFILSTRYSSNVRNVIFGNEYIDDIEPYDKYDSKVYECTESQFIIQKAIKCSQVDEQIGLYISEIPGSWSDLIEYRIPYPEFSEIVNAIKAIAKEDFFYEDPDDPSVEEMADLIIEFNEQVAETWDFFEYEECSVMLDDFLKQYKAGSAHPVLNTCLVKK